MEPNMMSKRTVVRVTHVRSQACVQDEKLFIIMILCATISKSTAREPAISSHRHSHIRTSGPTYIRLLKLRTKDRWETHISIWKSRSHRKKTPFGFLLEAMVTNDFDVSIFLNNNDVTWCKFRPLILFLMLLLDVDALKIQLLVSRVKQPIKSIKNVWEICQVQGIIRGHDFLQLT